MPKQKWLVSIRLGTDFDEAATPDEITDMMWEMLRSELEDADDAVTQVITRIDET